MARTFYLIMLFFDEFYIPPNLFLLLVRFYLERNYTVGRSEKSVYHFSK